MIKVWMNGYVYDSRASTIYLLCIFRFLSDALFAIISVLCGYVGYLWIMWVSRKSCGMKTQGSVRHRSIFWRIFCIFFNSQCKSCITVVIYLLFSFSKDIWRFYGSNIPPVSIQHDGNLGGVMAVAFATDLLQGIDPSLRNYEQCVLRKHF